MRKHYEKFRNEFEEIEEIFKKKMIEGVEIEDADPELIILTVKCFKLLKTADEFTLACIDAMENQDKKLDKILEILEND